MAPVVGEAGDQVMTMRLGTAAETAANFRAAYEARTKRRPVRRLPQTYRRGELAAFRDVVLSKIGRLSPRWPAQIWQDVRGDWGEVDAGRVDRAIAWCLADGQIIRTEDGYLLARGVHASTSRVSRWTQGSANAREVGGSISARREHRDGHHVG